MTQQLKYTGGYGTEKQIAARIRNRKIFQLRGLYHNAKNLLTPDAVLMLKFDIDRELTKLGAETTAEIEYRREQFFSKDRTEEEWKQFKKPFGGKPRG